MADFREAGIFRGHGRRQPLQNSSNYRLSELLPAYNRGELPARRLRNRGDSEDAVGMAGSALLVQHNTISGVEFRGRRFARGRDVWRPNINARDDAVYLSCRDYTIRRRSPNR